MKSRNDIDPENTWVVSDTHFGHENIKGFCHRPPDMESIMIEEWAQAVPDSGVVIHLGDLSYRGNAQFRNLIAPHLTGDKKFIVLGNHDRQRYSFYRNCGFKPIVPFKLRYNNWTVSFSHYPWNEEFEGEPFPKHHHLRLHGHIHNNGYTRNAYVPFLRNHVNLSVEQTKYRPVNLKLLLDGVLYGDVPDYEGDHSPHLYTDDKN